MAWYNIPDAPAKVNIPTQARNNPRITRIARILGFRVRRTGTFSPRKVHEGAVGRARWCLLRRFILRSTTENGSGYEGWITAPPPICCSREMRNDAEARPAVAPYHGHAGGPSQTATDRAGYKEPAALPGTWKSREGLLRKNCCSALPPIRRVRQERVSCLPRRRCFSHASNWAGNAANSRDQTDT